MGEEKVSDVKKARGIWGKGHLLRLNSFFSYNRFLHVRFLHKKEKIDLRHQHPHVSNEKSCDVFILWKIVEV